MIVRVLAGLLLSFALVYQELVSIDSIHVTRHLDFYVPFTIAPFTSKVDVAAFAYSPDYRRRLNRGQEILEINGVPFKGMSTLLRAIRAREQTNQPIAVKIRDSLGTRTLEAHRPHCTCGIPSLSEAIGIFAVSPIFCLLLGFALVLMAPTRMLNWTFLALLLSLSQLTWMPEVRPGFQLASNEMSWEQDWLRIPAVGYQAFVQSLWPAALVGFMACAAGVSRLAVATAAVLLTFAVIRGVLAIAWSEHYRELAPLFHLLDRNQTELIIGGFAIMAALGYTWHTRLGALWTLAALGVSFVLLLDPQPLASGYWAHYADNSFQFVSDPPKISLSPHLAILGCACFMTAAFAAYAPIVNRSRVVVGLGLCLPLAIHSGGVYAGMWWLLGPWGNGRTWIIWVLVATASGVLTLASWVKARHWAYDGR
jgi:hypothetical protein